MNPITITILTFAHHLLIFTLQLKNLLMKRLPRRAIVSSYLISLSIASFLLIQAYLLYITVIPLRCLLDKACKGFPHEVSFGDFLISIPTTPIIMHLTWTAEKPQNYSMPLMNTTNFLEKYEIEETTEVVGAMTEKVQGIINTGVEVEMVDDDGDVYVGETLKGRVKAGAGEVVSLLTSWWRLGVHKVMYVEESNEVRQKDSSKKNPRRGEDFSGEDSNEDSKSREVSTREDSYEEAAYRVGPPREDSQREDLGAMWHNYQNAFWDHIWREVDRGNILIEWLTQFRR